MGKETVKKLQDIGGAAIQAGLEISVPTNSILKGSALVSLKISDVQWCLRSTTCILKRVDVLTRWASDDAHLSRTIVRAPQMLWMLEPSRGLKPSVTPHNLHSASCIPDLLLCKQSHAWLPYIFCSWRLQTAGSDGRRGWTSPAKVTASLEAEQGEVGWGSGPCHEGCCGRQPHAHLVCWQAECWHGPLVHLSARECRLGQTSGITLQEVARWQSDNHGGHTHGSADTSSKRAGAYPHPQDSSTMFACYHPPAYVAKEHCMLLPYTKWLALSTINEQESILASNYLNPSLYASFKLSICCSFARCEQLKSNETFASEWYSWDFLLLPHKCATDLGGLKIRCHNQSSSGRKDLESWV